MRGLPILLVAACAVCAACAARQSATKPTSAVPKTVERQREEVTVRPHHRTTLTPDVVVATIKDRYLAGVQRCYRRHAKMYGASSGRVMLQFTVDRKGQTRDGSAHGIARQVDGCITAQLARWQFPAPAETSQFALSLAVSSE
jgi:type IV pilus biogenesis protein CpaD/CtpE